MKFEFNWPSSFREEDVKMLTDGRWTPESLVYYKLTNEPSGPGELKTRTWYMQAFSRLYSIIMALYHSGTTRNILKIYIRRSNCQNYVYLQPKVTLQCFQ